MIVISTMRLAPYSNSIQWSGAITFYDGYSDDSAVPNCSVPDDHIDPRRSALFMARSVLRNIRDGGANACSTS